MGLTLDLKHPSWPEAAVPSSAWFVPFRRLTVGHMWNPRHRRFYSKAVKHEVPPTQTGALWGTWLVALGRAELSELILARDVAPGHHLAAPSIRTSRAEAFFGASQRQWA